MRRLLLPVALLVAGCGGHDGSGVFERGQAGLARVTTGTIELHVTVDALVPIERTATLQASEVPLARLHLARWAKHPRRYDCGASLECARADLDVASAARELEPVLPSLPFDPASVDSAKIEIAVGRNDGLPRRARLEGDLHGVQFTVDLEVAS
ncbi:MAG: hypothetical protein M3R39_06435 [Actinomycetota bacterium]|nr:hypothetical protein [Actinomycetota bacterium]